LLWRHVDPVEQLRGPEDLARWLREAGLVEGSVRVTDGEAAAARALRESIYRLFGQLIAGRPYDESDVAVVNNAAARAGRFPRLTPSGAVGWSAREPVAAALAAVAGECIELLTGPLAGRVRECAAPDCAFLFVDTSRQGSRRWCAQNRCGNRQRVREHRARRALPEGSER
jgi:predicted RNA-binding Zn ribbon-like protein